MKYIDVFNGDADGICALHQFRLANPVSSTLVTGVKRDIQLLDKIESSNGDIISVFDISLDKNKSGLIKHLDIGAEINYFDHHFAGDIPSYPKLYSHIDTSAETCTSVIVDDFLGGAYRLWAVTGAFGDGFDNLARELAKRENLTTHEVEQLRVLGILINYNAYGSSVEDLHINPEDLYKAISRYKSPFDFLTDSFYAILERGYAEDNQYVTDLNPSFATDKYALYILPNENWARRISGVFANDLNKKYSKRAHALLTEIGNDNYLVSVRAPETTKTGADELCRQFETGGGRKAAAGINKLPVADYDLFVEKFKTQFA